VTVAVAAESVAEPRSANPKQTILLLGPQGRVPILGAVLKEFGITDRIATVTAGWQEREDEIQALQAHLDGRSENLRLYQRADEAFQSDPELRTVHHERQRKLRHAQGLYDVRLRFAMAAAFALDDRSESEDVLEELRAEALEAIRELDTRHLDRVRRIHEEFEPKLKLDRRPSILRHRKEIAAIVKNSSALAIAGGHVAVLLNRLRLFDVPGMMGDRPIVGWSAGAMVLCERVVLYHDSPPQGPGNAEVFEHGFGACRDVVAIPHAKPRLQLDDTARVARFAKRFSPDQCLALDDEAWIATGAFGWRASPPTRRLTIEGSVVAEGSEG
jgi:hypothetical protein